MGLGVVGRAVQRLGAAAFEPSEAGFTCTRTRPETPEALLTALAAGLAAVSHAPLKHTALVPVQAVTVSVCWQVGALLTSTQDAVEVMRETPSTAHDGAVGVQV